MDNFPDLRELYARPDFLGFYHTVATHIKIRRVNGFVRTREFIALSPAVKETMQDLIKRKDNNYETFTDEGSFYHTDTIILHQKEPNSWIGWFQYNYMTNPLKIVLMALGFGVGVAGVWYFGPIAVPYLKSLCVYIHVNYTVLLEQLIGLITSLLTGTLCSQFIHWLTSHRSDFNMLIAACILKKLQSIRGVD